MGVVFACRLMDAVVYHSRKPGFEGCVVGFQVMVVGPLEEGTPRICWEVIGTACWALSSGWTGGWSLIAGVRSLFVVEYLQILALSPMLPSMKKYKGLSLPTDDTIVLLVVVTMVYGSRRPLSAYFTKWYQTKPGVAIFTSLKHFECVGSLLLVATCQNVDEARGRRQLNRWSFQK